MRTRCKAVLMTYDFTKVYVHLLQISDYADFVTTVFYTKEKLIDPADENNRENSRFIVILEPTFPQGPSTRWQVDAIKKAFVLILKSTSKLLSVKTNPGHEVAQFRELIHKRYTLLFDLPTLLSWLTSGSR